MNNRNLETDHVSPKEVKRHSLTHLKNFAVGPFSSEVRNRLCVWRVLDYIYSSMQR